MSTPINGVGSTGLEIIEIVPNGDIILDVTFETSKPVILAAKKAFAAFSSRPTPRTSKTTIPGQGPAKTPVRPPRPPPKPRERVGFRVHLSVLKEHSPYFARLLSDTRFSEAKAVEAALAKLSLQNTSPGEADWTQLPRVSIREDDEATQSAEVRYIFHDLLYILHHGRVPPPADETSAEPPAEVTPPEPKVAPAAASPTPKPVVSKPAATTKGQKPGQKPLTKTAAKGTQPTNGLKKPLDKTSQKGHGQPKPTLPKPETPDEPITTEPAAPTAPPLTIPYLTTLALLADRFSCTPSLSRLPSSSSQTPLKWPATPTRLTKDQDGHALTFASEELLRQKILVSWLLDLPLKFQSATRELILYGSRRWTLSASPEDSESDYSPSDPHSNPDPDSHHNPVSEPQYKYKFKYKAKWWSLPDTLEDELLFRRTCLLSTLASIPRHFLRLYIVRPPQTRSITTSSAGIGSSFTSNAASALQAAAQGRQCKLGYESSASCDSYQLGEMIRFLCTKGLFSLVDFSPASFDRAITQYDGGENPLAKVDGYNPGMGVVFGPPKPSSSSSSSGGNGNKDDLGGISTMEINHFVAVLRQCPSYQIDRHHTNCGLRTRMLPVLDYVQALLNSEVVFIKRADWEKRREEVSWVSLVEKRQEENEDGKEKGGKRVFRFTRTLAADPRMRYNSTLGTSKMAMELFLADEWDWTAEEY